ncbi:hypothetical protein CDD81_4405 [Ophiocordyceps australis]|uniref:Uncharacterized protein n=1 Tax=Ophiocordyceps australis TaxID=1399860 RepID=A0A2C5YHQ5_9HYPO|nr:hypothetical protein CDD81_4405 [Ophiocordyceps australis]
MNSLKVPESGLRLDGPSEGECVAPPQAFVLSLSDDILKNLVESSRNGDELLLSLGSKPTLHYGSRSHRIAPPSDDSPMDVYVTKPFESTRKAERIPKSSSLYPSPKSSPPIETKKTAAKTSKNTAAKSKAAASSNKDSTPSSLDSDYETLQNSLAAHAAAKERSVMIEKLPASKHSATKAGKAKLWANYNSGTPKSMPTSPALNASHSPSSGPVLSASEQVVERKKEQRVVLVHELAVKERSADYLRQKWVGKDGDFQPTLEKTADFNSETKTWALRKGCWKELDVWRYDYDTKVEREAAISNAIRQYDKQRLSSSETEWQRLLPIEERGKGKCLSRLQANLAKGPAQPAPKIKVQRTDDSTASKDDADGPDSDKAKAGGENMSRSKSNPLPKAKKPTAQEAQARRLMGTSKAKSAAPRPPPKPKAVSKPNGGRVLSAAIIENSDSSGDEAPPPKPKPVVSKPNKDTVIVKTKPLNREPPAKEAQTQPAPVPPPATVNKSKRQRDDEDSSSSSGTPLSKRIKTKQPVSSKQPIVKASLPKPSAPPPAKVKNTSPTKPSPLASSPPTNASDLEEVQVVPSKKRKLEIESKPAPSKRRVVETVPSDILAKAYKFKAYYQKYAALHFEMSALDNPPNEKVADLLDMHSRLESMKKEIYKQCSPKRI